jgi:acyl-coenzyme A thioesterase PaaI-like protein
LTSENGTARIVAGAGVRPFDFTDHNCFACGSLNRHGLGLVLHVEPAFSWTQVTLDRRFEGWDGIAHGGILCAILDEVMAWALVGDDNWGLTARLSVDFKAPVRIGEPFRGEGRVSRTRRRLIETAGRLVSPDGAVLATATATYVAADPARRRELHERYGFRWRDAPETVAQAADDRDLVRR